ncbi:SDR family NAD(P)-dependent oxidoreductase, partial [Nocardioides sp. cx-169]|uniref:SDR family NAD(P)-dependent oxidoreductase n=1 Tax=Nocardioides sp. cx-169 TaxID=2899080 RepID=UPI001E2F49A2
GLHRRLHSQVTGSEKYRFDDRVAVVTGAGRGLGRSYAHLLGRLGAKVVVNDFGGSIDGIGGDVDPARAVAKEIEEAGGEAVADASDVSTEAGGRNPIELAIATYGRVDIVINNAGITRPMGLPDVDIDNIERILAVHVKGAFNTIRAAWPHLVSQGYGRVVNTSSIAMFGSVDNLGYATAKSAMIGMARSMSASAKDLDIKVNVIAPNALTRMATGSPSKGLNELREQRSASAPVGMEPELVAPMVGYLAHQDCNVSGEVYIAGGGRFAHMFVGMTEGYLPDRPEDVTINDVANHLAEIKDPSGYYVPTSLADSARRYMAHR